MITKIGAIPQDLGSIRPVILIKISFKYFREESGKGGFHRIYWHRYDKDGFSKHLKDIVKKALETLKHTTE